jgi:hypothetical protein
MPLAAMVSATDLMTFSFVLHAKVFHEFHPMGGNA